MTPNLADTIKGLEALRERARFHSLLNSDDLATLDAALLVLRSQEETVRRCAEICTSIGKDIVCPEECAAAILAAHGLKE